MNYEELYNKSMSGDMDAFEELEDISNSGDAHAQYILSCVLGGEESPFKNTELSVYWLKKSILNGNEQAKKALSELSTDFKRQYGLLKEEEAKAKVKTDKDKEIEDDKEGEKTIPYGIWSVKGRIDRTTYAVYTVIFLIIALILFFCMEFITGVFPGETITHNMDFYSYTETTPSLAAVFMGLAVRLIMAYLFFTLQSKRAHDCSFPCWIVLIPFVALWLLFKEGEPERNGYGPAPK